MQKTIDVFMRKTYIKFGLAHAVSVLWHSIQQLNYINDSTRTLIL